ncbi:MAG: NADH-quinone oxidoreductase subunit L [Acetobacteraceae bacterium]|nr:NADH-quinone oxidoreductase subunit L [Acetobacteraceae bacterium]
MTFITAVFAPLFGAMVSGLFGRIIGDRAAIAVSVLCMLLAAACGPYAWVAFEWGGAPAGAMPLGDWIVAGDFQTSWSLRYDALSTSMVAMVTFVSMLIHVYSIGYLGHDKYPRYRFFAYLNLFTFSMLMLVTADNLLQLFFGWEGVGLCSYLLIGYWYDRPSACAAAIKAFVVNRVADLFFAIGLALIFLTFGSLDLDVIFSHLPQHAADRYALFGGIQAYEVMGVLLFIGAMGKSAQLFFHTWLPDAMEGPTPVSALIHAATMVTAGVFLMARMSPLMDLAPAALTLVEVIGATTCIFAATIGCVQNDIKKVIAYSTCSQLGYMFMAAGVMAYPASIFHLLTHAFFKALLFLCAGSVIHAMSDEQDMRRMGGLWRKIPVTYVTMWIGSLALGGIFPFAGYFSKDAILEAAFAYGSPSSIYAFIAGTAAAFCTAFYSWRVLFMTFHGTSRADRHVQEHVHESPWVMLVPLIVLSIGAIVTGYLFHNLLIGAHWDTYWRHAIVIAPNNHVMERMEDLPGGVRYVPLLCGLAGIAVAYWFYMLNPMLPIRLANTFRPVYLLLLNKYYFDEIYDFLFVRPAFRLARLLWHTGDATLIDGVPNGLAAMAVDGSKGAVRVQTGSIAVYAFVMLIGLVALVGVFLIWG